MSNENDDNDFGSAGLVWPHADNPAVKVTDSLDRFELLTRDDAYDAIILQRPQELRQKMAFNLREAFDSVVRHDYGERRTHPVIISAPVNVTPGRIQAFDQIPAQFQTLRKELDPMFRSFARTASSNFMLFASEDTRFFGTGGERHIPVLMAQWTVAGKGALEGKDRTLIGEGNWGYFPAGTHLPLHSWSRKDSTLSIILIPF